MRTLIGDVPRVQPKWENLTDIFERLGSSAALWQARLQKLSGGRSFGRFLSTSRERLREVAERLGVHHLANLDGCPA